MMLDGSTSPGKKLVRSVPFEKLVTYTKRASLLPEKKAMRQSLIGLGNQIILSVMWMHL